MAEKLTPIEKLMQYMDACARARGEASFTQGYRALYENGSLDTAHNDAEAKRLYEKEQNQWKYCAVVEARFRRYAQHLLRKAGRGQNYKAAQRLRTKLRRRGAKA